MIKLQNKLVIIILTLILISFHDVKANSDIQIEEFGKGAAKYWLIYNALDTNSKQRLIVFLHGYGASNPACYGGWIRHLVESGEVILFPKFQQGTFLPKPNKIERLVHESVESSLNYLKNKHNTVFDEIIFIGHSIGGIIAANLADEYGRTKKHYVAGLFLVQPGHKFLKLGRRSDYSEIDSRTKIIIIIGNQ
ncbi:MAG: alpha/beta fold hydrolase, partial [Saprospiraceae bacterium]|nr:alpha/beta fold hydrolase [Saprospiraceae bacterium]